MGRDRQFRGGMDGHRRPFDWLALARQHGVPEQEARSLYEEAVGQAGRYPEPRLYEESIYLELLADARRRAWRPSPGKVTRTMRLQAHRAGKRRGPHVSHLTGQPITPGKQALTWYLEPAVPARHSEEEPLEANATSFRGGSASVPVDSRDALALTRGLDNQEQPGKARAVPSRATRPSAQDIMVPGTIAHRRFQANLAAAFGYFEELEALEEEGLSPELMAVMEAPPTDEDREDFVDADANGWPPPSESQFTREWQAREWLASAWTVQLDDSWPEASPEHARSPAWEEPYQVQLADKEGGLLPLMAIPGRQVESWGAVGPIQAAGLEGIPEVPVHLPGHGGGTEMPDEVRAKMEAAFGVDFSAVRIYQGTYVEAVGALAYTHGTDIHFAPRLYQPESRRGQELLAHELTHVVQQSQGRVLPTRQAMGSYINDDASLEREADEMGARAARWEVREPSDRPIGMSLEDLATQEGLNPYMAQTGDVVAGDEAQDRASGIRETPSEPVQIPAIAPVVRQDSSNPALACLYQADGGEPLPPAVLMRMSRRFNHNFTHVRIHTDESAAAVARLLGARALTLGADIYFGAGEYELGTPAGDRLLNHELMHVIQYDQGRLAGGSLLSHRDDPVEQEARVAETQIPTSAAVEQPSATRAFPVPARPAGASATVVLRQDAANTEPPSGQVLADEDIADLWQQLAEFGFHGNAQLLQAGLAAEPLTYEQCRRALGALRSEFQTRSRNRRDQQGAARGWNQGLDDLGWGRTGPNDRDHDYYTPLHYGLDIHRHVSYSRSPNGQHFADYQDFVDHGQVQARFAGRSLGVHCRAAWILAAAQYAMDREAGLPEDSPQHYVSPVNVEADLATLSLKAEEEVRRPGRRRDGEEADVANKLRERLNTLISDAEQAQVQPEYAQDQAGQAPARQAGMEAVLWLCGKGRNLLQELSDETFLQELALAPRSRHGRAWARDAHGLGHAMATHLDHATRGGTENMGIRRSMYPFLQYLVTMPPPILQADRFPGLDGLSYEQASALDELFSSGRAMHILGEIKQHRRADQELIEQVKVARRTLRQKLKEIKTPAERIQRALPLDSTQDGLEEYRTKLRYLITRADLLANQLQRRHQALDPSVLASELRMVQWDLEVTLGNYSPRDRSPPAGFQPRNLSSVQRPLRVLGHYRDHVTRALEFFQELSAEELHAAQRRRTVDVTRDLERWAKQATNVGLFTQPRPYILGILSVSASVPTRPGPGAGPREVEGIPMRDAGFWGGHHWDILRLSSELDREDPNGGQPVDAIGDNTLYEARLREVMNSVRSRFGPEAIPKISNILSSWRNGADVLQNDAVLMRVRNEFSSESSDRNH
jgi:hypothetical protein